MGSATAEEWLKGLESRGRERRNDASRWERWDISGGIVRMRGLGTHELQKPTNIIPTHASSTITPATNNSLPPHPGHHVQFPTNPTSHLPLPVQNGFGMLDSSRLYVSAWPGYAQLLTPDTS